MKNFRVRRRLSLSWWKMWMARYSSMIRSSFVHDTQKMNITLTVPMFKPVPPNYYVSIISDCSLHAEPRLPISFKHLILPKRFPPPTPLFDLQPLPLSALHNKELEAIYSSTIQPFNNPNPGFPTSIRQTKMSSLVRLPVAGRLSAQSCSPTSLE